MIKNIKEIESLDKNIKVIAVCERCGKEFESKVDTILKKGKLLCRACSIKATNLERYGVENVFQSRETKEKTKATNLEKYGVENISQNKIIREKVKTTVLERYGVENVFQSRETKEKTKATNLEKYGVENISQNKEIQEKVKSTNLEKYGTVCPLQNKEIQEKTKATNLEKYGVENYNSSENFKEKLNEINNSRTQEEKNRIQEKIRATNLEKFGFTCATKSQEIQAKARATMLKKYGAEFSMQSPELKKKIFSHHKKTAPERKMEEFLKNRGFDYQFEFECNSKNFDFAVFKNGELSILIEIDGEYFHGLYSDYDGHHVRGESDCARFQKVPDNVKFIACDSSNIEKAFTEITRVFDLDYESWIAELINSLPSEFPYPEYSEARMIKDYSNLCKSNKFYPFSRIGDSIIRNFHKSIWSASVGDLKSPLGAWNDKVLLEKTVRNRVIYSSSLSSQAIVNGFNVSKIAPKVSVFSAALAKDLVMKYLNDFDEIFDPFSGFSGRMIGICASGKKYIGQDINAIHVNESKQIKNFLELNAVLDNKNVFNSYGQYKCLFTCPPYNLKENWNNLNQENFSCDEWIDICLQHFKCDKYLFVVDRTETYKNNIVGEIKHLGCLQSNSEYIVLI